MARFLGHMKAGRVALRPRKKQNICPLRDNLRGGMRGRILGGSRDGQSHQLGIPNQDEQKRNGQDLGLSLFVATSGPQPCTEY